MLSWLQANIATLLVALVMLGIIAFVVAGLIRDLRRGGSSCASCGSCGGCAGCKACSSGAKTGLKT